MRHDDSQSSMCNQSSFFSDETKSSRTSPVQHKQKYFKLYLLWGGNRKQEKFITTKNSFYCSLILCLEGSIQKSREYFCTDIAILSHMNWFYAASSTSETQSKSQTFIATTRRKKLRARYCSFQTSLLHKHMSFSWSLVSVASGLRRRFVFDFIKVGWKTCEKYFVFGNWMFIL